MSPLAARLTGARAGAGANGGGNARATRGGGAAGDDDGPAPAHIPGRRYKAVSDDTLHFAEKHAPALLPMLLAGTRYDKKRAARGLPPVMSSGDELGDWMRPEYERVEGNDGAVGRREAAEAALAKKGGFGLALRQDHGARAGSQLGLGPRPGLSPEALEHHLAIRNLNSAESGSRPSSAAVVHASLEYAYGSTAQEVLLRRPVDSRLSRRAEHGSRDGQRSNLIGDPLNTGPKTRGPTYDPLKPFKLGGTRPIFDYTLGESPGLALFPGASGAGAEGVGGLGGTIVAAPFRTALSTAGRH